MNTYRKLFFYDVQRCLYMFKVVDEKDKNISKEREYTFNEYDNFIGGPCVHSERTNEFVFNDMIVELESERAGN